MEYAELLWQLKKTESINHGHRKERIAGHRRFLKPRGLMSNKRHTGRSICQELRAQVCPLGQSWARSHMRLFPGHLKVHWDALKCTETMTECAHIRSVFEM